MRIVPKSICLCWGLTACLSLAAQEKDIYHKGWIDFNKNGAKDVYEDPQADTEARIDDLMRQMTLEEKAGQLLVQLGWPLYERQGEELRLTEEAEKVLVKQGSGGLWGFMRADPWTQKTLTNGLNPQKAVEATNLLQRYCIEHTRLGIPVLLSEECPHGHMAIGATSFPTGIGQASTWNPDLLRRMGEAQATEIRKQGGHIGYGPVMDLARDARWSRVEEGFGEDPYLSAQLGMAVVRGMQDNPDCPVISTVKHFAAYGVTEGGHNGGSTHMGETELNEQILPPFRKLAEAGMGSLMASYNEIDGVPCTGNRHLLTEILRKSWNFEGLTVSDLYSIDGLTGSGVAASLKDAARIAILAGVETDLGGQAYQHLPELVKEGAVPESVVDAAVRRVLRLKFRWNLFDAPFLDGKDALTAEELAAHRSLAREIARQSIVLLKNEKGVLPLRKDLRSIAVIGPNADAPYNLLGDYTAPQAEGSVVTVLDGIRAAVSPATVVNYAKGCAIRDMSGEGLAEAKAVAEKSDAIVLVLGGSSARDFSSEFEKTGAAKVSQNEVSDMESGEGNDRRTLELLGRQNELLELMKATGKPLVVVLVKGRPLAVKSCKEQADALLDAWYPGVEGGNGIADVLFGDYNPAGRLPVSVPETVGQVPVYYNHHRGQNRGNYVEGTGQPLYPFGYGLSYTTFAYEHLEVIPEADAVRVKVRVRNTGARDGDEVVQVYVQDRVASHVKPVKELKAFRRVGIKAGEAQELELLIDKKDLEVYQGSGVWRFEPGDFRIWVGGSSDSLPLEQVVWLEE